MKNVISLKKRESKSSWLINEICQAYNIIKTYENETFFHPKVKLAHDSLLRAFQTNLKEAERHTLFQYEQIAAISSDLKRFQARTHVNTEIMIAQAYLKKKGSATNPFIQSWINPGFQNILNNQLTRWKHSGILNNIRNICIVGGGALPQTQVILHKLSGLQITSIDKDPSSCELCSRVLAKLKLSKSLKVVNEDGCKFNYQGFDMVILATLVPEKIEIAQQVFSSGKMYFSPRVPVGLHELWRNTITKIELEEIGWLLVDEWFPKHSSIGSLTLNSHAR